MRDRRPCLHPPSTAQLARRTDSWAVGPITAGAVPLRPDLKNITASSGIFTALNHNDRTQIYRPGQSRNKTPALLSATTTANRLAYVYFEDEPGRPSHVPGRSIKLTSGGGGLPCDQSFYGAPSLS